MPRRTHSPTRRSIAAGFTVTELLVVFAIIGLISVLGLPQLQVMLRRSRHEAAARELAVVVRAARLEAVKRSLPAGVAADAAQRRLFSFVDENRNGVFDDGERILDQVQLPSRVELWGPCDAAPGGADAVVGFAADTAVLQPSGRADSSGAYRLGDELGNFLEIRIDPPAAARVDIKRFVGLPAQCAQVAFWRAQGEGGQSWSWN